MKEYKKKVTIAWFILFLCFIPMTSFSTSPSEIKRVELLTLMIHHSNEPGSRTEVSAGEPFQVMTVIRNSATGTDLFTLIVELVDNTGQVSALYIQENVEVPKFRIASVTTQDSIVLDKVGVYSLKVFVIDDFQNPTAFAYRERLLNVFDAEAGRTARGTGQEFEIQIMANGRADSYQIPSADESANPPLYFEVRGRGSCSDYGDFSVRHDPFERPYPKIDFSYGLRDPDLANYINRVENVRIAMSEEVIIVEGSVVIVYDAPASGIFNLRFANFIAAIYPEQLVNCHALKSNYSANASSLIQSDFTHNIEPDYVGTPMIEELEYWVTGYQTSPESNVAEQFKFNFDIALKVA